MIFVNLPAFSTTKKTDSAKTDSAKTNGYVKVLKAWEIKKYMLIKKLKIDLIEKKLRAS